MPTTPTRTPGPVHVIPACLLDEAVKRIAKANRRLARADVDEQFTYTVTHEMRTRRATVSGMPDVAVEVAVIALSAPAISAGGWRFLAAVEAVGGGLITRTDPAVELDGWRPKDMRCEHCGHNRARTRTYLIEGPDGTRMQVGSTCLRPFLGVAPAGLWALGADPLDVDELDDEGWPAGGGDAGGGEVLFPVDFIIALALAISDDARNFVSRSGAGERSRATVDDVTSVLDERSKIPHEWRAEMCSGAYIRIEDGRAAGTLDIIRAVDGATDWAANLRTIAATEWVSPRHLALLVSGLVIVQRQREAQIRERAPKPTAGYAAPVGAKVKGTRVTITAVRDIEGYNPYTGQEETRSQVVMVDDAGHQLIWWASTAQDLEPGATATLTGGTVKKHDNYRDIDQTVVTRCKVAVDEVAPASEAA